MKNEILIEVLKEEIAHTVAEARKHFTNNWAHYGAVEYVLESLENDIYERIEDHKDRVTALDMIFTNGKKWVSEAIDSELDMIVL